MDTIQPASMSTLPPELVLDILSTAITSSLYTAPLVVHNQFTQLPSMCRTCCYRQIAAVCSSWSTIVREEHLGREVVFGVYGSEKDEAVLDCVTKNETRAFKVKKIDASLRGWQGWKHLPVTASLESATTEEEEGSTGFLQTREAQMEKQRQQVLDRERQRLVRLLVACRRIETFDIDVGFYQSIQNLPTLFPPTIRSLTLRNVDAPETFELIENLPLLDDLTLRLALDWRISPDTPRPTPTCRLRRFELSYTAFATARLPDVLTLLSSSVDTLESLTLRNKGTTPQGLANFLPVSQGLIAMFGPRLRQLAVKDIPRSGLRVQDSKPTWSWFPCRPTQFPSLRSLHLTGLPSLSIETFRKTFTFPPSSKLDRLTLEDFDSPSPHHLVDVLRQAPPLSDLKLLEVAIAKRGEGSEDGQKEIEEWCDGVGRQGGTTTELRASWRMRKVDHMCGMW